MPGAPEAADGKRTRFPAASRLKTRSDFDRVMNGGRKVVGRRLVLWVAAAPPGVSQSRLGLSVSRRVGNAVRRNRVKRVLREAFRRLSPGWAAAVDVVALARPAAPPTTLREARDALNRLGADPGGPRS